MKRINKKMHIEQRMSWKDKGVVALFVRRTDKKFIEGTSLLLGNLSDDGARVEVHVLARHEISKCRDVCILIDRSRIAEIPKPASWTEADQADEDAALAVLNAGSPR